MLAAWETIVNALTEFVHWVKLILDHIINFITRLPQYLNFVLGLVNIIPPFMRWFFMVAVLYIAIDAIIKLIRGSN